MSSPSRPRVFVSRRLFQETLDLIAQHAEMDVFDCSGSPTPEELVARTKKCHGLVAQGTDRIDAAFLDQCPDLRVVCNVAVGYNNIDVAAARERKVVVTNTPDVLNEACAALTWGLILGVTRRLGEGERTLRAGQWKGFQLDFLLGMDLVGKTLGIIGMGRIGQAVAAKAAAFGMRAIYMRSPRRPDEVITGPDGAPYEGTTLEEVLRRSDVVTLHCPLSPETHHLINRESIRLMKPSAYLVNMARGPVVEEASVVAALENGWIAGAALDVYELEPVVHPGLLKFENAFLIPHLGSATRETRTAMCNLAARNLIEVLEGRAPVTPIPGSFIDV
ncbi:D-glycerate dehydrogenase [Luteitalea sp. TBR-22]|uniref:2-hydroxyacid dehydrogenase n=1 Tax=Luteitalea sp. TBR-22 TaxID=2802971 RepID=UPI001AF45E79|nr:D-glycerate dehydrogenase [Luteitalea sp. TBR-22]BCS31486.1 D-glycerate dehydrogenase [Luteitalea sp. TBR-22]